MAFTAFFKRLIRTRHTRPLRSIFSLGRHNYFGSEISIIPTSPSEASIIARAEREHYLYLERQRRPVEQARKLLQEIEDSELEAEALMEGASSAEEVEDVELYPLPRVRTNAAVWTRIEEGIRPNGHEKSVTWDY